MSNSTPGPWYADGNEIRTHLAGEGRPPQIVARFAGSNDEALANAELAAASPELLDLAYQYLSDLCRQPTGDSLQRRIERAEAIIAKATGQ